MKCKNCIHLFNFVDEDNNPDAKWCPIIFDSPDPEIERECSNFRAMTNADRIRSMTDEELAEFLKETVYQAGENLFDCKEAPFTNNCTDCINCYLVWLQTEIE